MDWTTERPTKVGLYWCYQYNHIRMVNVWKYNQRNSKLHTNEDGGSTIDDRIYDGAQWQGPIQPPDPPKP